MECAHWNRWGERFVNERLRNVNYNKDALENTFLSCKPVPEVKSKRLPASDGPAQKNGRTAPTLPPPNNKRSQWEDEGEQSK